VNALQRRRASGIAQRAHLGSEVGSASFCPVAAHSRPLGSILRCHRHRFRCWRCCASWTTAPCPSKTSSSPNPDSGDKSPESMRRSTSWTASSSAAARQLPSLTEPLCAVLPVTTAATRPCESAHVTASWSRAASSGTAFGRGASPLYESLYSITLLQSSPARSLQLDDAPE